MDTIEIKSLADAINEFSMLQNEADEGNTQQILYFRGHANSSWELKPSLLRDPVQHAIKSHFERDSYNELILSRPSEFSSNHFLNISKLQHYGLPTRLLDVTKNPLVALYFSCESHPNSDGEIIAFIVFKSDIKRYDDTEITHRLDQYLDHKITKPLIPDKRVFLVTTPKDNPRIKAQHGDFLFFDNSSEINSEPKNKTIHKYTSRIIIPGNSKDRLMKELDGVFISKRTLFPELEHEVSEIKRRLT